VEALIGWVDGVGRVHVVGLVGGAKVRRRGGGVGDCGAESGCRAEVDIAPGGRGVALGLGEGVDEVED
jgi:hypothetical protein